MASAGSGILRRLVAPRRGVPPVTDLPLAPPPDMAVQDQVVTLIRAIRQDRAAAERFALLDALLRDRGAEVCAACNIRWLVAICDSYADHAPPPEAGVGLSISAMIAMLRLAETVRFLRPELRQSRLDQACATPFLLYSGVQTLGIDDQDTLLTLSKRLYRATADLPHLRLVLETILTRLQEEDSVLAELAYYSARPERFLPRDPDLPDNYGVV